MKNQKTKQTKRITFCGSLETLQKTDLFCPNCGTRGLYSGSFHYCQKCDYVIEDLGMSPRKDCG